MLSFWNINNRGTARSTMGDIWSIYQLACGGSCDEQPAVAWDTLLGAAEAHFTAQNPPQITELDHFEAWGDFAGVNEMP